MRRRRFIDRIARKMRFNKPLSVCPGWLAALCFLMAFTGIAAQAKDLKFQAMLVWATDAEKSPDHSHKPVDAEVLKKLRDLPLRWKNYFEVRREHFIVPRGAPRR